jgi:orotate phosphoribosyltransferase
MTFRVDFIDRECADSALESHHLRTWNPRMTNAEAELLRLLKERSLRTDGPFKLASGETSSYYIDARMTVVSSAGAHAIGEVLYERTKDLGIQAIGGLAVGAVPLATAAVITYHRHGQAMEGFWVRDKLKEHGTQKLIEGRLTAGMRVAVVDDVFTKGQSALKAIQAVREAGGEAVAVLALVDRLHGAEKLFHHAGVMNYQAVFTIKDLGVA